MKKQLFYLLFFVFVSIGGYAQTIGSVVSDYSIPEPSINGAGNAGDAVDIIMFFLNTAASQYCSNTLGASLKTKIDSLKNKYLGVLPSGTSAEFLVLTNKTLCQTIAIVQKSQEVHVVNNACSVNDILLVQPDLIYDPVTTGFFSINVKF